MLPILLVLVLVVMFLRRLALDGSHLTRLLIASAREFIADAEAVRLTQNPAALVSALRRIEGRSVIPGIAAGQDAMMIDGAHEGAFATHPTIAERVAAIVSVTGSMALIAPAHRDTRSPELRAREGFGRRPAPALEAGFLRGARQGASAAFARVSSGGEFNRLGLTREMSVGAVAAAGVFLWVHSADLGNPAALAKAFDPAPARALVAMGREVARCQRQGLGSLIGLAEKPTGCSDGGSARGSCRRGRALRKAGGEYGAADQRHVQVARRDLQQRCAAGRPACRGPGGALLPDRALLSGRPRPARGDGTAEAS